MYLFLPEFTVKFDLALLADTSSEISNLGSILQLGNSVLQ